MNEKKILAIGVPVFLLLFMFGLLYKLDLSTDSIILFELRLPRLVLSILVGVALGYAGYFMQLVVQNPLADPYVLGSSGGAALMVALVYLVFPTILYSYVGLIGLTFAGAWISVSISIYLSRFKGQIVPYRMVLIGMGIAGFSMALVSLLMYVKGEANQVRSIVFWTFGSFQAAQWTSVIWVLVVVGAAMVWGWRNYYHLKMMEIGEEHAERLGVSVQQVRRNMVLWATLLTAVSVSFAGPIGFVGLIVPHMVRRLLPTQLHVGQLTILWLLSGGIVLTAEVLSSFILYPQVVPAGVLMTLVGVPVFILMMSRIDSD
ncbi:MAG: iron ABC transporter permease [Cytophagaceae bacterium]|jgi:iron complex transport system permease protein|nr:iron ABC transporter permease [Cytophagaceae bacterium]